MVNKADGAIWDEDSARKAGDELIYVGLFTGVHDVIVDGPFILLNANCPVHLDSFTVQSRVLAHESDDFAVL